MRTPTTLRFGAAVMLVSSLGGCVVGPNYQRPTAPVSATFKEADGWKPSQPADGIDRGAWWSIYNDPVLDQLERKVAISNQNIAAAEAAYRQARALTAEARSEYFPVISGQATAERSKRGGVVSVSGDNLASPGSTTSNTFNGQLGATWAVDLWGRIRRTVEENREAAQSAAADIASARLSAQTELAVDYFSLRVNDAQKVLLDDTIKNYQRALDITQNQYDAGVAAKADVITAQTQVQNAQASAVDLGVQRAAYEHAIAMLIGAPPAELTIAFAPAPRDVPVAPLNVASTLLERRPDIAVAERSMASANAGIGVAVSAYYPDLTLSGAFGYSSSKLSNLFRASNQLWSFGPSLADNLIDFGARKAQVQQARAIYDQRVAQYRQTVLSAFQGVEDQIAALRVLEQEATARAAAEASARQAEQLALNQYRAGQVSFTTVVTAQNTALASEQSTLSVLGQRLNASVTLIENLGGGWATSDLPNG